MCFVPFALVIGFISIYFIASAGFETYYFATFVFPVKHYPADIWNNPQAYFGKFLKSPRFQFLNIDGLAAPSLFIYFLIPYVYLIFFVVLWFKRQTMFD